MKSLVAVCTLLVLGIAFAGCAWWDKPAGESTDLSLACEVTKCECRTPQSAWTFRDNPSKPVLWHADGSAYCPVGLSLSRVTQ